MARRITEDLFLKFNFGLARTDVIARLMPTIFREFKVDQYNDLIGLAEASGIESTVDFYEITPVNYLHEVYVPKAVTSGELTLRKALFFSDDWINWVINGVNGGVVSIDMSLLVFKRLEELQRIDRIIHFHNVLPSGYLIDDLSSTETDVVFQELILKYSHITL